MKFIALAAAAVFVAGTASAQQLAPSATLDAIKARGHIECGVHLGLPGFSPTSAMEKRETQKSRCLCG